MSRTRWYGKLGWDYWLRLLTSCWSSFARLSTKWCCPIYQPTVFWSETIGASPGSPGRERLWMVEKTWKVVEKKKSIIPLSRLALAALLSMNPVIPWYTYCSCNNDEFCKQLELQQGIWLVSSDSAEAASLAEARFQVNQSIITHQVFTSLLFPVMTVIMARLLHIFTIL